MSSNLAAMNELDADALRERLDYDPQTGQFTYRKRCGPRRAGEIAGWLGMQGYWLIHVAGRLYLAHRLAFLHMTGRFPEQMIDHRNGKRADNRWHNLREATRAMNAHNQKKAARSNRSSGLLGVTRQGGRWQAQITVNRRSVYLGLHETPEAAHAAYLAAKRELHAGNLL